ncbi:Rha family transcriptional regulator [Bacillus thuringiensis]|uniref:Rha family transcriptional regulator n=1 Tax=Bacillus thuringiensis TaxID=1428 RepID=UPI0026E29F23|nr:Rha family transcriptional regulator [Bacillus thuringiensis]MDO6634124.1 Rha family transcriptional regulator [Bacillus thuringiensis]MDO6663558.1 Rha family transcriptional regulator [Bacillus thuringiensis]MDO6704269.1 Rha family transcriptional regulator [Bacillus thuringiensis]
MNDQLTVVQEQPLHSGLVFESNGEVVTDSLTIAEMFTKEHKNVKRDISETISKLNSLKDSLEVEDLGINFSTLKFEQCNYKADNGQVYIKYVLNFDAFMLVTMSYTTQKAMLIKMKYINEFNRMKEYIKKKLDTSQLSPELQMFNKMFTVLANQEIEQKRLSKEVIETKEKVESISEIVALNTTDWRKETTTLLNKISSKLGGFEMYRSIRNESYDILEHRANANLNIRVTNTQKKMALEGVPKSRINKVSKLDVINDDKRLLEIYLAVVKEMAIKYQVKVS